MTQQVNSGGVVVLGGINMDLVTISARFPQPGETVVGRRFLTYPGGKGANQAVAAARMGAATAMVGRVGDDVFGPQLIETLTASGINVEGVAVAQDTTSGIAVINIDESAQNQIIQILGANDTCGDAEAVWVRQALANASTLMLQLEVSVDLSLRVAKEAFEQGKTVILDPGPVRPIPPEFFPYCSVITPNETEAQALVGFPVVDRTSAAQAAEQLLAKGVGVAVVKLGAQGVYFATTDGGDFVTPFQVDAIDSVAAGDAFNGALAVSLAVGATLEQSVRTAAAAGALAVTKSGAQDSMPYRKEVEGLLG
jgi:ribokinase